MFSCEFCEVFKNTFLTKIVLAIAFKIMLLSAALRNKIILMTFLVVTNPDQAFPYQIAATFYNDIADTFQNYMRNNSVF